MALKVAKELNYRLEDVKNMPFAKTYSLYYGLLVLDGSVKPGIELSSEEKDLMHNLSNIDMNDLQEAMKNFNFVG